MKIKSYIFLSVLIVVLVFILGVRYGQKVEQTNKVISYLISITPAPTAVPTVPLEFEKYSNKTCGIEFTYPSTVEVKSESTGSALLVGTGGYIAIDCNRINDMLTVINDKQTATASVTFKNRPLAVKTAAQGEDYVFSFYNPQKGKNVYATVDKRLYPLFESSLQFMY